MAILIRVRWYLIVVLICISLITLATSCKELTPWKRPWCWEGFGAGGEGDNRRWDGWMASLSRWIWVWVNSGSWWWTGRPGVLLFIGSKIVGHNWVTELNWTELNNSNIEHLFVCLQAICMFSLAKSLFIFSAYFFKIGLFVFLILNYMNCLCILEINPLSVTLFANIFSHSVGCLFV